MIGYFHCEDYTDLYMGQGILVQKSDRAYVVRENLCLAKNGCHVHVFQEDKIFPRDK